MCVCVACTRVDRTVTDTELPPQGRGFKDAVIGTGPLSCRTGLNVKQQGNKKTMESHDSLGSPPHLLNGVRNGRAHDR